MKIINKNYPKSYGSINKYLFKKYTYAQAKAMQNQMLDLFNDMIRSYKSKNCIPKGTMGWEYSIKIIGNKVLKKPVPIFPQVNSKSYHQNSIFNYKLLKRYYGNDMIAQTKFIRQNKNNIVEQEFLNGPADNWIEYSDINQSLKPNLINYLHCTKKLLMEQNWMPDLSLEYNLDGFWLKNTIIIDNKPKLIDFSYLFDSMRLHPKITLELQQKMIKDIDNILKFIK